MTEISSNRTEGDGCSSGSSSSSSVRAAYQSVEEEGATCAQPTVNLATWQQQSSERYASMATMLDEVKRDINNLSDRLRKSPYVNEEMQADSQSSIRPSSLDTDSYSSDEIAQSVRQSLTDMGRRLREAGESPTLEMDLQMDSFPSPVSPRVMQLDNRSEDELFLNPFQQEFIRSAPQKTWRSPSDVSSSIAGDLAMAGDYTEFSDRTRIMLQRIRRERHEERLASPPGSPTFEPVECENLNLEDFILDTFLEEVEAVHHRYRSLPTILEERPEDLPPSSSSSSFSDESDEEMPPVIEMQTLGSSEDITTNLDDSPRGHPSFVYGQISATPNLALMVEQDAARDPGFMEHDDEEGSTSYFSAVTGSDSETFATVTDDDEDPKRLPCGTLFYARPSQTVLDETVSPYDYCESSSDSDGEGDRTLGRDGRMWSSKDQRQAPDGSTTEEVMEQTDDGEIQEEVLEMTRIRGAAVSPPKLTSPVLQETVTVIDAVQETKQKSPIIIPTLNLQSEVPESLKTSTFINVSDSRKRNHPPDSPPKHTQMVVRRSKIDLDQSNTEDDKRLSVESFGSISEQSTLSEIIVDTGEAPSDYSTETATETDSSDSRSDPGDLETDMYHGRKSPGHCGLPDDGRRKHFKPTLPPAAVYKPPVSKRPKMSSITESRSSDEETTSDDNNERQTIDDQPLASSAIGRESDNVNDVLIAEHVSERVEHESGANTRENSTGTPNSELTLSGAHSALPSSDCSEDIPTTKEVKIGRESDVTLSRSSSAEDMNFEDAMENVPNGQRADIKQEVIPASEVVSANRKGPVVAVASSRALVKRGANFSQAPETKPVISTEVKAEASGASASIAAARATARAASIATANASPHSPTSEDLHIYISTSCTIKNQAALPPDDVSLALTQKSPTSEAVITEAHQLPRLPVKDSSEPQQRENIFSWLNSGNQVATTTHELPSASPQGGQMDDMHTLESAAFQVLEKHTRDPGEATQLAGRVVNEVKDRDLSAPSVYCPRPFTRNERYSEVRRSLENLQQSRQRTKPAPSTLLRANIRAHTTDSQNGSRFVEMSDVSVKQIPTSAPGGKVESTFVSDSSGSSSPDDRNQQSKFAPYRYRIRPEFKSILQKPVDVSDNGTNSYTRSGLAASPSPPIKGNGTSQRHEKKRNDFFSSQTDPLSVKATPPVEMKLAEALKSDVNFQTRSSNTASTEHSARRLRDVVDDDGAYQHTQYPRRRRRSCKTTDIDQAIRSSTKDLTEIDTYDELDTAPGKFVSVSLYDLNAAAGSAVSPPPPEDTESHNPAKTFFAATAKSLTSLLQTDIDTGLNAEEPLVIETNVDSMMPAASPLPSKARSMVDLMARSPLMSPSPLQTYDVDLHLNRTQSMMLPEPDPDKQQPMTLRERLEMKAKSQTELRIAKSLTKLNVPRWLDNVPLKDDNERSRHRSMERMERPERPHSASAATSVRRPVVIETRVSTPSHSLFQRQTDEPSPTPKFELPSQKFRNSYNEKLQPIKSKLRDSLPNLFTDNDKTDEKEVVEANTVPRKATSQKALAPLKPIRLDATDFTPKKTVRQVKREKTVETRTVQRSEIVAQGSLSEGPNGNSNDGGQSSPDSGYIGSRTWPQTCNGDSDSPYRSVKVTETTVVETAVRQGDEVVESDHYKTSTHEEWTDSSQGDLMRDFVERRFDQLASLGASERLEEREYVHAVSAAIRYFGLTDDPPLAEQKVKLDDDEVLAAFFDSKQRGVDISAILAGEDNSNLGPSLLHAGIVTDRGRHYLRCMREQCSQQQLLVSAQKTYTSCPACFTYYCSELCATWDRNTHMAHCACSRLTNVCQKVIRSIHTDNGHRRPIVRLAKSGLAAFGRGFVLLSFCNIQDARRFLAESDNDLRSPPCYVSVNDPAMPDVFGKSVESMRTACTDYDTSRQFVIVVSIANRATGRTVKKSATLPVGGGDDAVISHSVDLVTSQPLASAPTANGQKEMNGEAGEKSDDDTIDSSEDSSTSSGSDTETESEYEENQKSGRKDEKAELVRRQEENKRKAGEEEKRRRAEEEELRQRREEELRRKKLEDEVRKLKMEEGLRQIREEEMRRKEEEEMKRLKVEEDLRQRREEELQRKKEEEMRRLQTKELRRRKKEEEVRRKKEDARKREEEEAKRKKEEELRKKQEDARKREEDEAKRKKEKELRRKQADARKREEEEAKRKKEELSRLKMEEDLRQRRAEDLRIKKAEEDARRKKEEELKKQEEDSESDSENESSSEDESESETDSDEAPVNTAPSLPPRTSVNNRHFPVPVPSRPPPRPPVQAPMPAVRPQYPPPPRPMPRASLPAKPRMVALANSQSPSGSISSLGSNPDNRLSQKRGSISSVGSNGRHFGSISSLTQDSSNASSLDLRARQSLLELTERKMMAHGINLRVSFPELSSHLIRFTEQNVSFPRRTIYPTDSRTGRRLACTFICGREPIIQFVPLSSSSRTSTPNLSPRGGPGLDANSNVPQKAVKPTVETEL